MLVCVLSNRTSPGATSLAVGLGMVWADQGRAPILAECDPGGGLLGLRFGMAERPSLATFASDTRRGATESSVAANVQSLHGMQCLLGPADPRVARRAAQAAAPNIAQLHPSSAEPWICDLGRISENSAVFELARSADLVLIVTRTSVAEVQALVFGVGLLRAQGCELGLVCVGEKPNPPREIAELTDVPLYGVLPDDPAIAAALGGGEFNQRQLRKSSLWRSIVHLASELETKLGRPQAAPASPAEAAPAPAAPAETAPAAPAEVAPAAQQPAPPSTAASPPVAAPVEAAAAASPPVAAPVEAAAAASPPVAAPVEAAAAAGHHMPPAAPDAPAAAPPDPAPAQAAPAQPASEAPAAAPAYDEVQVWTAANAPDQPLPPPSSDLPPPPVPRSDPAADPFATPTQQNQPTRPRFDDEDDITIPRQR